MRNEEKSALIQAGIARMRPAARKQRKRFDGGDLFLALAFRTDDQLKSIARACGL
ncbi:MAG: hypothetical protein PVJ30_04520 [Thiohalocapsa sp.]|jgi:hypothetical protein|uniref:hypothetical protein n=1 Tax=Thiohalocapsa sp. TaxID=2497641 RepID=UPI0025F4D130|nr:hypothetical protein [Thiohalocapsa sp.]